METSMSDYISRQAAIETIRGCTEYYHNNMPTMIDKASAQTELMMLPDADVRENVRGEWIDKPNREFCFRADFKTIECNQCGYNMPKSDSFASNFCPNCGADMRGEA